MSVASVWEVAIKYRIGKLPVSPRLFRDALLAVTVTEQMTLLTADTRLQELDAVGSIRAV